MRPQQAAAVPISVALTLFSIVACTHTEPFAVDDSNLNRPLESGSPARLTWAEGEERAPSWVPGGTSFIYSFRPAGPTPDPLYLTRSDDSRIFMRTLSTGIETEAHRFEGGAVAGLGVTGTTAAVSVGGEHRILDLSTRAEHVVAGLPLFLDQLIVTAGSDTLIGVGAGLDYPFELGSSI